MGLDLYIDARIREKKTGRLISADKPDYAETESEKGFFNILWWDGFNFAELRDKLIEISNQYAGTHYTNADLRIPFPQSALREMCRYILSRSCTPEEERFICNGISSEWDDKQGEENLNFEFGRRLRQFIYGLDCITYQNQFLFTEFDKYIPSTADLKRLKANPQAYEWEFVIVNSE